MKVVQASCNPCISSFSISIFGPLITITQVYVWCTCGRIYVSIYTGLFFPHQIPVQAVEQEELILYETALMEALEFMAFLNIYVLNYLGFWGFYESTDDKLIPALVSKLQIHPLFNFHIFCQECSIDQQLLKSQMR